MKKEYLLAMSESELDLYGRACGIDTTAAKGVKAKAALIAQARERTADIHVMGMTLTVPIKKMRDKTVGDRIEAGALQSNAKIEELMVDLLGAEQWEAIIERCTDEDGTVDIDAFGVIVAEILSSTELKNY